MRVKEGGSNTIKSKQGTIFSCGPVSVWAFSQSKTLAASNEHLGVNPLAAAFAAAHDARCLLRRAAVYSQSPDHPILPAIPETEYLKGFAFEIVR